MTDSPRNRPVPSASAESDGGIPELRLVDVPLRQSVELVRIDLPGDQMERLLEAGVLPGCRLCPVRRSPFGDPILEVDGSVIAVRREIAACLCVRNAGPEPN